MMNVLRNWPSGTMGRISAPIVSRPAAVPARESGQTGWPAAESGRRDRGRVARGYLSESQRQRAGGRHARRRHRRRQHQLRRARRAECVDDGPPQHLVHQALIEKAHFRFRRVHVDVDAIGRQLDEQVHLRAALLDCRDAVGLLDGVRDGAVADDALVDEDVLRPARGALLAERRDESAHAQPGRLLDDRHQIRPVAVDLIEALLVAAGRRRLEQDAAAAPQDEADVGIAERQLGGQARHLRRLGGVGLQELAPRGQVEEQVADLDERPFRRAGLGD
jgi:hypothetical protein